MKRIFTYHDEKSAKFWSIDIQDTKFEINFGKLGTAGQTQTKTFETIAECQKQANKLINEKCKKGYIEDAEMSSSDDTDNDELDIENLSQSQVEKILRHISQGLLNGNIRQDEYEYYNDLYPDDMDECDLAEYVDRYPQLRPLMVELLENLMCYGNAWVTDEEQAGSVLSLSLALSDKKYCQLFAQILAEQDLDHEVHQNDYIESIIRKWGLCAETAIILQARQENSGQHGHEFIDELREHYGEELNQWLEQDVSTEDEDEYKINNDGDGNVLEIQDKITLNRFRFEWDVDYPVLMFYYGTNNVGLRYDSFHDLSLAIELLKKNISDRYCTRQTKQLENVQQMLKATHVKLKQADDLNKLISKNNKDEVVSGNDLIPCRKYQFFRDIDDFICLICDMKNERFMCVPVRDGKTQFFWVFNKKAKFHRALSSQIDGYLLQGYELVLDENLPIAYDTILENWQSAIDKGWI